MASRDIYQQTVDQDVQQNDQKTCPECSGRMTTNSRETVCDDCGLVLVDERIDRGPEWREFDDDPTSNRRAGSPNTVARHDRGSDRASAGSAMDTAGSSIRARRSISLDFGVGIGGRKSVVKPSVIRLPD